MEAVELLHGAVVAPLMLGDNRDGEPSRDVHLVCLGSNTGPDNFVSWAYEAFAMSFLTQPLALFERGRTSFPKDINLEILSSSVLKALATKTRAQNSQEELLWLLSHLVALRKSQSEGPRTSMELRALYTLLAILSSEIRLRIPRDLKQARNGAEASSGKQQAKAPSFVASELSSLVDDTEISQLLEKFTS